MECRQDGDCFKCIHSEAPYDFAYECAIGVLYEMDDEERADLAKDVLETAKSELQEKGPKFLQQHAEALGDCLARLFLFGLGKRRHGSDYRPRYIDAEDITSVLPLLRRATKRSQPAIMTMAVVRRARYPQPKCWMKMTGEYDGPRRSRKGRSK